jgi:hypothetical protein
VALKDKHRRASSHGEKVLIGTKNRSTSKTKNKSFFETQTDDRKPSKTGSNPKLAVGSGSANITFLKKLKKIGKAEGGAFIGMNKPSTVIKTREHSFIGGAHHQRALSNANEGDKTFQHTLQKNTSYIKSGDQSLSKGRKPDYTGDWPANTSQKQHVFDPKQILKNIKETSMDKNKAAEFNNISGVKESSKSNIKSRTIKDNKSKGRRNTHLALNDFIHTLNRQLEFAANQLRELKREMMDPGFNSSKEEFIKKIKAVYDFTSVRKFDPENKILRKQSPNKPPLRQASGGIETHL